MMKRINVILLVILLSSCSLFKPSPPASLLTKYDDYKTVSKDFKIVDSYKFPLNDADISNGATDKWCIAYTESYEGLSGLYEQSGSANLWVKIGEDWINMDFQFFSPYEELSANKTSCEYLKERYLK